MTHAAHAVLLEILCDGKVLHHCNKRMATVHAYLCLAATWYLHTPVCAWFHESAFPIT